MQSDAGIITGQLEKKGHMIKNWHQRFFRFDPADRMLAYYENENSLSKEKGSMTVTSVSDVPER